jgi:hypothetical protein
MSCLAEAPATLLTSKPRSSGLECDFGCLNGIITWGRICKGVDDAEVEQASNAIRSWKIDIVGQFRLGESNSKTPYFDEELQIEDDDGSFGREWQATRIRH